MKFRPLVRLTLAALFVAALLVPATAAAQDTAFGIRGGVNMANISFDVVDEFNPTTETMNGMILGAYFRKDFTPQLGLQLEGLYAQGGAKLSFVEGPDTFEQEISLDSVQIPVLFSVAAMANDSGSVRFFAGPTFAFKVSQSEKFTLNGEEFPVESDEESNIKSFDTGLTFGVGFNIRQFIVDLRYTLGLTNINGDSEDDADEPNVKTRQFAVTFGFNFGKK